MDLSTRVRSRRLRLLLIAAAIVLPVAGSWWALRVWVPAPPRHVTMATGPEGSAYARIGERYRSILARSRVDLRLRPTAGAVENLALLRDAGSGVSIAFAQPSGAGPDESHALASLGTLFYEPLWLFHRDLGVARGMADLRGRRLAVGPEGGGTRELALRMLEIGGIDAGSVELLPLSPEAGAESLMRGEIDGVLMLTSWDSPLVQRLLRAPGIELAGAVRADAHVALTPFLTKLVLPAGVVDIARNVPPADLTLVASKASLAIRADLHPAIQYLLLDAAEEVHARPGVFHRAGEFPAEEAIELPLTSEARQYHKSGRPWMHRYLPFRLAIAAERSLFVIVPLLGIVYPLARALPALFAWTVRRRIFKGYRELKAVEAELGRARPDGADTDLLGRLDELERRVVRMRVPRVFAWHVYTLRQHIQFIRDRVRGGG